MSGYQFFLIVMFLFFFGSFMGWVLELFYRRFLSRANPERVWLNPGFLYGPCVPLYGFGTVILFILSEFESQIFGAFQKTIWFYFVMFFLMALVMTFIEYLAGLCSIKVMHIRLWDYSSQPGNIQGLICPQFTLIWGVLCAVYYFLLYPRLRVLVGWFIANPLFSFFIGVFFGVFVIDCAFSIHLGAIVRKRAGEIDRSVYESVDLQALQRRLQSHSGFFRLRAPRTLSEQLERFDDFLHRKPAAPEAAEQPEQF